MSGRLGPYGRPNSFGRNTSGFRGWMPVNFVTGTGTLKREQKGWKNVLTNQEFTPPEGWNGEPPCPTGELVARHVGDLFRQNYDQIRWDK